MERNHRVVKAWRMKKIVSWIKGKTWGKWPWPFISEVIFISSLKSLLNLYPKPTWRWDIFAITSSHRKDCVPLNGYKHSLDWGRGNWGSGAVQGKSCRQWEHRGHMDETWRAAAGRDWERSIVWLEDSPPQHIQSCTNNGRNQSHGIVMMKEDLNEHTSQGPLSHRF